MTDIIRPQLSPPESEAQPGNGDLVDMPHAAQLAEDMLGLTPTQTDQEPFSWEEADRELGTLELLSPEQEEVVDAWTESIISSHPEAVEEFKNDPVVTTLALQAALGAAAFGNDPIGANAQFYKFALKEGVRGLLIKASESKRSLDEREGFWRKAGAIGARSGEWINLLFVEYAALYAQGLMQADDASSAVSLGVGISVNVAMDTGITIGSSFRNRGRNVSKDDLVKASIEGYLRGGAMGAGQNKLPPKWALLPVAAYTAFALKLGLIGEYSDNAKAVVENETLGLLVLGGLGLGRIFASTFNTGTLDNLSDRIIKRIDDKKTEPSFRPPRTGLLGGRQTY